MYIHWICRPQAYHLDIPSLYQMGLFRTFFYNDMPMIYQVYSMNITELVCSGMHWYVRVCTGIFWYILVDTGCCGPGASAASPGGWCRTSGAGPATTPMPAMGSPGRASAWTPRFHESPGQAKSRVWNRRLGVAQGCSPTETLCTHRAPGPAPGQPVNPWL
jgi:hypothetical protein